MSGVTCAPFTVTIPLVTVSESNSHTHWRQRQKRAKAQRATVHECLRLARAYDAVDGRDWVLTFPLTVTLTRIAPRRLDPDNAVSSLKHCIDGVADFLGVDDRDERIRWAWGQRKGGVREYGVEITICSGA